MGDGEGRVGEVRNGGMGRDRERVGREGEFGNVGRKGRNGRCGLRLLKKGVLMYRKDVARGRDGRHGARWKSLRGGMVVGRLSS